jgi:hypothetical protein
MAGERRARERLGQIGGRLSHVVCTDEMPGLILLLQEAVEALKSVQRLAGLRAALTLDDPASGLLEYAEDTRPGAFLGNIAGAR